MISNGAVGDGRKRRSDDLTRIPIAIEPPPAALGPDADRIVRALVASIQLFDDALARQAHCVAALAAAIASELGLGADEIERCLFVGYLHDIGSIGVSRAILDKPGPLSTPEWEVVRSHAACGGELLLRVPELAAIASAVRAHHERFDGHGYPDQLRGDRIPVAARIVGAADAFYALISPRTYREPVTYQGALQIIEDGRGGHWDPIVVDALLERVRADSVAYVTAASA